MQDARKLPTNVAGWYRGVFANAASLAPITAAQVAVNGTIERAITNGTRRMSDEEQIGCAMAAGTFAACVTHPIDTAKTLMQSDLAGKRYTSASQALVSAYNEGGIRSLYKGGMARTVRICGAFFIVGNIREYALDYKNSSA